MAEMSREEVIQKLDEMAQLNAAMPEKWGFRAENAQAFRMGASALRRLDELEKWARREIGADQAAKPFSSGPYINAEHILDWLNGDMHGAARIGGKERNEH